MSETLQDIIGEPRNFIEEEIEKDIAAGKVNKAVHTRFPPEPNGDLTIPILLPKRQNMSMQSSETSSGWDLIGKTENTMHQTTFSSCMTLLIS